MGSWSTRKVCLRRVTLTMTPETSTGCRSVVQTNANFYGIEVAQNPQEPTNGTELEGVAEDDTAGGMSF